MSRPVLQPEAPQFGRLRNFRDAGGLGTEQGGRMRAGLLYRSEDLSPLAGRDLDELERLGIRLILDLRSPNERAGKLIRFDSRRAIRVESIPIYQNGEDFSPRAFLAYLLPRASSMDFERFMLEFYRHIAFDSAPQIGRVLDLLSDRRNLPAVIHCTGGKDRTGTLSAMIQLLLGVPRHAVLEHYLATNERMAPKMRKASRVLRMMTLYRISAARLEPFLEARREYLEGILDEIQVRYGTMERFLTEACQVSEGTITTIQSLFLEESP